MQSGNLASSDVQVFTSRITVNGVTRAHESWSVDRELVGDLPDQVASGAGVKQATGSVVWAVQPDVAERTANPWNASTGWLPKSGDSVVIWAGDGVREWKQFDGIIDETSGDVGALPSSSIIDRIDQLSVNFSQETVIRSHPPKTEGGDYMGVGMSAVYMVDRAMRYGGFYCTPRLEPAAVVAVHGQGSMWPRLGALSRAGSVSGATHAGNNRAPWGWAVSDFDCAYTPVFPQPGSAPLQMTFCIAPDHAGSLYFRSIYSGGTVEIAVTPSRACVARFNGAEVCRLIVAADATVVSLVVRGASWTLKTNSGGVVSAAGTAIPSSSVLNSVTLRGDVGVRVAGFQVSSPTVATEFASLSHVPNAFHRVSGLVGFMDALPSLVNVNALDVLDEVSKATLSAMWIDETGVLQFRGSDILRATGPSQTLTTLDDIQSLSWQDSLLSTRSKVTVKYQKPAIDRSQWSNILLWQGSGETMQSNQEKNLFAEAPNDEDWAEIDHVTVAAEGLNALNSGRGTWMLSYLEKQDGTWMSSTGYTNRSISTVNERTRLFQYGALTLPAGYHLVLSTPEEAVNYASRFRDWSQPALRGRGRVQWAETTVVSPIVGPAGAPELVHDAGKWNSRADDTTILERIGEFIASQVSKPQPVITGMRVGFDPRRQLGDVITISSPQLMGVELQALIIGKSDKAAASFTQSLSVRIISARSTFTTHEQFNAAGGALTHAQWQMLAPVPLTHSQFNAQPSEAL